MIYKNITKIFMIMFLISSMLIGCGGRDRATVTNTTQSTSTKEELPYIDFSNVEGVIYDDYVIKEDKIVIYIEGDYDVYRGSIPYIVDILQEDDSNTMIEILFKDLEGKDREYKIVK